MDRRIPDNQRKRALFSCDRCKQRKVKCRRVLNSQLRYDNTTPCIQCSQLQIDCSTTIPRKKRNGNSMENLSFNYTCLRRIMEYLYPDRDFSSVGNVIRLGKSLGVEMPLVPDDIQSLSIILTQDKLQEKSINVTTTPPEIPASVPEISSSSTTVVKRAYNFDTNQHASEQNEDKLIYDTSGKTHFIGSSGTPSILRGLADVILTKQYKSKLSFETNTAYTLANGSSTISEFLEFSLNTARIFNRDIIPKDEFDFYIQNFMKQLHPIYFILNEKEFMILCTRFWNGDVLTNYDISMIFMVVLLGNFNNHSNALLTEEKVNKITEVIKVSLLEYIYSPSLEGIKLMFFMSVYLFSNKNRELSWILLCICSIQLISLGFHKESIVFKFKNELQEEIRILFWTIFKFSQINGSNFGRGSIFKNDDIDLKFPEYNTYPELIGFDLDLLFYRAYNKGLFELSMTANSILTFRSQVQKLKIFSQENIDKNLSFNKNLNSFFSDLPPMLHTVDSRSSEWVLRFNIHYHYFQMILTLPFLLHVVQTNAKLARADPIITILTDGIESAIQISLIMQHLHNIKRFSGVLQLDVFYSYVSVLVLILSYFLLLNPDSTSQQRNSLVKIFEDSGVSTNSVLNAIDKIKTVKSQIEIKGTMIRMNDTIDYLLKELGIDDELKEKNYLSSSNTYNINESVNNYLNVLKENNFGSDNDLFNLLFGDSFDPEMFP